MGDTVAVAAAEDAQIINAFREGLVLPRIDSSLLRLDYVRSLEMRITMVFRIRGRHRLELTVEGFTLTNAE